MRRIRHALRLALLTPLCLVLTGCPQPNVQPDLNATPLVKEAVESRANLHNLIGRGEMKIVDEGSDFSLSVRIEMSAQTPDRLRIRATKLADAIVAFDMLMYGKDAAFYVPTRNVLYKGNAENLRQGGVNFSPREIIARILHSDRGLLDRQWKVQGQSKEGLFRSDLVLEQVHAPGQPYVTINVDGRKKVLLKVMHYNAQNKLFFVEEYNGYKEIMTGQTTPSGNAIGSGVFLPSRFTLSWPDKGRLVSVTLRDYEYDTPEAKIKETWTIDDLDMGSVNVKDLNQVNVAGDREAGAPAPAAGASGAAGAPGAAGSTAPAPRYSAPAPAAPAPATGSASGSSAASPAGMRGRNINDPF